jgi:hypothetical protein
MSVARTCLAALAACAGTLLVAAAPQAAVVVDESPTGAIYGTWSNNSAGQNFLVQFTLASSTDIAGIDIFTGISYGDVGTSVTVKIRNDVAGSPAAGNLYEFVDAVDSVSAFDSIAHISSVDFSPFTLGPGTYWMGVSGTGTELSWLSYSNGGTAFVPSQKQLSGNNVVAGTSFFELAYRIRGAEPTSVPAPATLTLAILALAAAGAVRRRA